MRWTEALWNLGKSQLFTWGISFLHTKPPLNIGAYILGLNTTKASGNHPGLLCLES